MVISLGVSVLYMVEWRECGVQRGTYVDTMYICTVCSVSQRV